MPYVSLIGPDVAAVAIALVAILILSPDVYAQTLHLARGGSETIEVVFLVALSALIATLVVGVLRRRRWAFWLILVAFLFGSTIRARTDHPLPEPFDHGQR